MSNPQSGGKKCKLSKVPRNPRQAARRAGKFVNLGGQHPKLRIVKMPQRRGGSMIAPPIWLARQLYKLHF